MSSPLLVYDGSKSAFRTLAEALAPRVAGLKPVPWGDDEVQAFLEAQFGDQPFSFLLVEGDEVHVGDAAVERLLERAGLTETVASLAGRAYPAAAGPMGRVIHGRVPADRHGTYPLTEAAAAHLEPLRRSYDDPEAPADESGDTAGASE